MHKVPLAVLIAALVAAGAAAAAAGPARAAVSVGAALDDSSARPPALDRVPDPGQEGVLWFAQTGHTLAGPFRAFWEQNGGLAQFGYPLSEEFDEYTAADAHFHRVQYFQRNRFEAHPEFAGTPHAVLLGLLGHDATAGANFPLSPPFPSSPDHLYFPQTQHSIEGVFLTYWQTHGGLPIYGYPISEEVLEQNSADGRVYLVQYFERNRFELHPEHRGTPDEVQMGLLGEDLLRAWGWLP